MTNLLTKIKETLNDINNQALVVEVFKTGSQLFRDNPVDLDYVIICENFPEGYKRKKVQIDGLSYDFIFRSKEDYIKLLNFDFNDDGGYEHSALYNYFYNVKEIIYGKWEYGWNILDFEEVYKSKLKDLYYKTVGKRVLRNHITKGWVHYYIILKIFDNNSLDITDEMLRDINTLYTATNGEAIPIINWIESQINKI